MATDNKESPVEKAVEFFTQGPDDREYEGQGGDDRVPKDQRTSDPKADANKYAQSQGEKLPYPDHAPVDEGNAPA